MEACHIPGPILSLQCHAATCNGSYGEDQRFDRLARHTQATTLYAAIGNASAALTYEPSLLSLQLQFWR